MKDFTLFDIFVDYLGGCDNLLKAYTSIVIVGIISEVIFSFVNKKNLSPLTIKVLFQKIAGYFVIGIGNIMDTYLIMGDTSWRTFIIIFYITYEALVIIDNFIEIGLPIPNKIKKILECIFDQKYNKSKK